MGNNSKPLEGLCAEITSQVSFKLMIQFKNKNKKLEFTNDAFGGPGARKARKSKSSHLARKQRPWSDIK